MFLYYLIIAPIEMIVEWVFYFFVKVGVGGIITAVMGVSIVINFLALPLYNIADALQDKERQISRRLEPRLKRIRKAFKGDEQFMMISTYYRQNDYHPLYVLRSSLSILIEIPFFIAAYHFLSHCPMLLGEHFWIFKDLGSPDRMWTLTLGTFSLPINILPIIMTLINVVSAAVYTRGGTVKEKVQIYALAAIFLVLLYESPSGLVIYWILNNLFSLAKNVIQKMKHPHIILCYIIGIGLLLSSIVLFYYREIGNIKIKSFVTLLGLCISALPTIWDLTLKSSIYKALSEKTAKLTQKSKSDFFIFLFSTLGLAILLGLLLPASVIATSPTEFSFLGKTNSPFSYIHSTLWTFLGMCVFWPMCIYFMFDDKVKHALTVIFPALLICALCNIYIFKPDYGNLNSMFLLSNTVRKMRTPLIYSILSLVVFFITAALYYLCKSSHKNMYISVILLSLCLGMTALGLYRSTFIQKEYRAYARTKENVKTAESTKNITPVYHLSKEKQNVIILFLDRALGIFVPYIMQEFPQLQEQFDGFIYYPNTVSYGRKTNTGLPSMVAGYEYTPDNINKRSKELLVDKHNEACLVMPKLFADAGFDVTVTDMPWINYLYEGDPSIYEQYQGMTSHNIIGQQLNYYTSSKQQNIQDDDTDKICKDKIRYFSLLQCLLPLTRHIFYVPTICDLQKKEGYIFLLDFSHLYALPKLTDFDNTKNSFLFITNNATHEYTHLNVPDYETIPDVGEKNNNEYQPAYKSDNEENNRAYQVNAAALKQVGKWLVYLKDNGVYDNTRIIIVADHGHDLKLDELYHKFIGTAIDPILPAMNNPLFMVKDFNAHGNLKTDNSFMSNADTIYIAKQGLNLADTNPFTGKKLIPDKSNGITVHFDSEWNATVQKNRTTFLYNPNEGYIVRDNLFDPANWTPIDPYTNKELKQ